MADPRKRFLAFGVEPEQRATFELRQARYHALGEDVAAFAARQHAEQGTKTQLLDVGVYNGCSRRYIEVHPGAEWIDYHAVDIFPRGREFVYKSADWTLHHIDLEQGMAELPTNAYDVVLCEQVLEHLHIYRSTLCDLVRVLRPGGLLIVGVPTFPHGLHWVRKNIVPRVDHWLGNKKPRGHVQAWSKATFLREFRNLDELDITAVRGFRIVSGGLLRPLEFHAWWWKLNRWVGSKVPSLCTEIQVVGRKRSSAAECRLSAATQINASRRAA